MSDWSWYTFHSMTIAWWKSHTTPREQHECVVHDEEKHEYPNLFFSLVDYDACFHIDKTK
jgi:hypothetical protein